MSGEEEKKTAMARVFLEKTALRKQMLKTLRSLSEEDLERQSNAVTQRVLNSPFYRDARTIGCYLSMGKGELRTKRIIENILRQGKTLFVPYIPHETQPSMPAGFDGGSGSSAMRMLRMYGSADLERCPLDKWGIIDPGLNRLDADTGETRQDCLDASAPDLDLVLVPGVAFDGDCKRLGRGKAYYDRFLAQYGSKRKSPLLVALALKPQIMTDPAVPVTDTDFQLDGVVHPDGMIWRTSRQP